MALPVGLAMASTRFCKCLCNCDTSGLHILGTWTFCFCGKDQLLSKGRLSSGLNSILGVPTAGETGFSLRTRLKPLIHCEPFDENIHTGSGFHGGLVPYAQWHSRHYILSTWNKSTMFLDHPLHVFQSQTFSDVVDGKSIAKTAEIGLLARDDY